MGAVGRRELETSALKENPVVELHIDDGRNLSEEPISASSTSSPALTETDVSGGAISEASHSSEELQTALRSEAYHWPRLVFPPLKKSGHIILDGCTAEGLFLARMIRTLLRYH